MLQNILKFENRYKPNQLLEPQNLKYCFKLDEAQFNILSSYFEHSITATIFLNCLAESITYIVASNYCTSFTLEDVEKNVDYFLSILQSTPYLDLETINKINNCIKNMLLFENNARITDSPERNNRKISTT